MPTNLRKVRSFAHLVRYLEDELGWPLEGCKMSEITFDYDPEDLGLKSSEAAKIRVPIRQLRPLTSNQPWGIFFIEFDRTRLPIAVLRRILSHLVIKKRASANRADGAAWASEDLLFISAFGAEEEATREINFAHFHQEKGDLPTLRVLGWDGNDTNLKVEHVDHALRERLRWPDEMEGVESWRKRWSGAFKHRVGHVINTADLLAEELAALARRIRDAATTLIARESENGRLKKLHAAFKTHLIHDLTEEGFADTYAQTIAYGLLTAAISRESQRADGAKGALVADDMAAMVPVTNPFLKEMLETFLRVGGRKGSIDFDELGVQDVVELLRSDETDLPAVLRDFGNKTRGEDPVIHFYEHFLTAYNKQLKIQRGVFYTPQPVVSYIVRSVHELVQTEFGLSDGLADTTTWGKMLEKHPGLKLPLLTDEQGETRTISPDEMFVQILDPATGTATFPVEVIEVIFQHLKAKWAKGGLAAMPVLPSGKTGHCKQFTEYWNLYVPAALLPRLHAFELMMAPYAIAHMKIGLKLAETGYRFGTEERARIYLTNALEPKVKQLPQIGFDALAHEAAAVNEIKWYKRFTVVIGNPPYSNFGQLNKIPFILDLLHDFKRGLSEKKLNLDDDFIKFIRFGQFVIQQSCVGVFGMVTSSTFLDGITHRRMREYLLESFNCCAVLDLHGSATKKETCPDGSKDENVFEIKQGVAVSILARTLKATRRSLHFGELWGRQDTKYQRLESTTRLSQTEILVAAPNYFFVPKSVENAEEYERGISVKDIFCESGPGIKTERDSVGIQHTRSEMEAVIADFKTMPVEALRTKYELGEDSRDWKVINAKADVRENDNADQIRPVLYRPFDFQWTWYSGKTRGFIGTPGFRIGSHMSKGPNLGLVTSRTVYGPDSWRDALVINTICEFGIMATRPGNTAPVFPLYLFEETLAFDVGSKSIGAPHGLSKRPNFTPTFLKALAEALQLPQKGEYGLPAGLTPEDIFYYTYAVFHSPGYRSRYGEFLKIDFPRLPLTGNLELFRALARLGDELIALHLLESPTLDHPISDYVGGPGPKVERISWSKNTVWLDKAETTGFCDVHESVWNFYIGGYKVCEKWLKDRKGRILSKAEIAHYNKIITALSETIRLMKAVDSVIEDYGAWPI